MGPMPGPCHNTSLLNTQGPDRVLLLSECRNQADTGEGEDGKGISWAGGISRLLECLLSVQEALGEMR